MEPCRRCAPISRPCGSSSGASRSTQSCRSTQQHATPAALECGDAAMRGVGDGGRGPGGHGVHPHHRRASDGELTLSTPSAKGMVPNPDPSMQYYESNFFHRGGSSSSGGRVPRPKMDFPAFTGERPKSWKRQRESYCRVFDIQSELWVDTATMHFVGGAQIWLENCGSK